MIDNIDKNIFRNIFQDIFDSEVTSNIIEYKLDRLQKMQVYEMKAFFDIVSHEEFIDYSTITYKQQQGILFLESNLKSLNAITLGSETKDNIISLVEDIYNCFNLIFPRKRFSSVRERAYENAESIVLANQEKEAERVLNALGLSAADDRYSNSKRIMLKLLVNKNNIDNLLKDSEYMTQRLKETKESIHTSVSDFNNEKNRLLENLKEENEIYKTSIRENITTKFKDIQKDVQDQRESIKKSVQQISILQGRLSRIDQNVYREELATYFLKEHDALKGKIEPLNLFVNLIGAVAITEIAFHYLINNNFELYLSSKILIFILCFLLVASFGDFIIKYTNRAKLDKKINFKNLREVLTPYWCWLFATLAGMGAILYEALELSHIIKDSLMNNVQPLNSILPYFGIYVILVWFTWFSSKQFSYTKQICDEYEYKYALSKSYIIYKNEAESVITEHSSNAVLLALLDSVIKNIAHSPVQSVKQDVHTPFSEVLKTAKDAVNISKE